MKKMHVELDSRGLTLRGYLELPDNASAEKPVPLLVMFHGFTGTISEKHFLLSRLSRHVVEMGVATLRLDFGGSGESDGDFYDVTPRTEVEDGCAILTYGCSLPEVDSHRVGLLGYSLGGFVATNVAAREARRLSRLVLISPGLATHRKMELLQEETGRASRGSLVVGQAFIDDGKALDALAAAKCCPMPVSIIQGTSDAVVPFVNAMAYESAFPHAGVTYVTGADHAYDTPEHFERLCDCVLAAVELL